MLYLISIIKLTLYELKVPMMKNMSEVVGKCVTFVSFLDMFLFFFFCSLSLSAASWQQLQLKVVRFLYQSSGTRLRIIILKMSQSRIIPTPNPQSFNSTAHKMETSEEAAKGDEGNNDNDNTSNVRLSDLPVPELGNIALQNPQNEPNEIPQQQTTARSPRESEVLNVIADTVTALETMVDNQRIMMKEKDVELDKKDLELKSLLRERDGMKIMMDEIEQKWQETTAKVQDELEKIKQKEKGESMEVRQLKVKVATKERIAKRLKKEMKQLMKTLNHELDEKESKESIHRLSTGANQEELKKSRAEVMLLKKKLIQRTSELQKMKRKSRGDWGGNNMELNRIKEAEGLRKQLKEREKTIAEQEREIRGLKSGGKRKYLKAKSRKNKMKGSRSGSEVTDERSISVSNDWGGNNADLNRIQENEELRKDLKERDKTIAEQERELRSLEQWKRVTMKEAESGKEMKNAVSDDWKGSNMELNRIEENEALRKELREKNTVIAEQERELRRIIESGKPNVEESGNQRAGPITVTIQALQADEMKDLRGELKEKNKFIAEMERELRTLNETKSTEHLTANMVDNKDKSEDVSSDYWGGNNSALNRIREIEELQEALKQRDKAIAEFQRESQKSMKATSKRKHLKIKVQAEDVRESGCEEAVSVSGSSLSSRDWSGNNMELNRIIEIKELRKDLKARDKVIMEQERELRGMRGRKEELDATKKVDATKQMYHEVIGVNDRASRTPKLLSFRSYIERLEDEYDDIVDGEEDDNVQHSTSKGHTGCTPNDVELNRIQEIERLQQEVKERENIIEEQKREFRRLNERLYPNPHFAKWKNWERPKKQVTEERDDKLSPDPEWDLFRDTLDIDPESVEFQRLSVAMDRYPALTEILRLSDKDDGSAKASSAIHEHTRRGVAFGLIVSAVAAILMATLYAPTLEYSEKIVIVPENNKPDGSGRNYADFIPLISDRAYWDVGQVVKDLDDEKGLVPGIVDHIDQVFTAICALASYGLASAFYR